MGLKMCGGFIIDIMGSSLALPLFSWKFYTKNAQEFFCIVLTDTSKKVIPSSTYQ